MRVILLQTLYFIPSLFRLSHRLGRRKILFEKRKKISDYALVMGMFGIIIMVIENELSSAGVYNKEDVMSTGLKALISISTVVLLVLIVAYHMLEIQVTMRFWIRMEMCEGWSRRDNEIQIAVQFMVLASKFVQIFTNSLVCPDGLEQSAGGTGGEGQYSILCGKDNIEYGD